jgi:nitrogen regulatory protein PII
MKAVFISHNQALTEEVENILDSLVIRGFTQWTNVNGRGSNSGEPHLGTHTWPSQNNVLITIIPDEKVSQLLDKLSLLNNQVEEQGLRAFVWNIEQSI